MRNNSRNLIKNQMILFLLSCFFPFQIQFQLKLIPNKHPKVKSQFKLENFSFKQLNDTSLQSISTLDRNKKPQIMIPHMSAKPTFEWHQNFFSVFLFFYFNLSRIVK